MRSDLNAFVVMDTFSDHELSPRGSLLYSGELEGEDHGNFQRSASIDQYEQASGRDHSDRIICESNTDRHRENQGNARHVEVHNAQRREIAPKLDERGGNCSFLCTNLKRDHVFHRLKHPVQKRMKLYFRYQSTLPTTPAYHHLEGK